MSQSYIRFHIGPVQSWIAQARRTQDLFAGSRILSLLANAGLEAAKADNADIVLPFWDPTYQHGIPNQFVLLVKGDRDQAQSTATTVKQAILTQWDDLCEDVMGKMQSKAFGGLSFDQDYWLEQTKNFIEVYYVITARTDSYQDDNRQLLNLMSTRKQLRSIYSRPEQGFKCSVTGEHEAMHTLSGGEVASLKDVRTFWNIIQKKVPNKALLSQGERLCAISAVKRMGHEVESDLQIPRFPSTSSIAVMSFRVKVIKCIVDPDNPEDIETIEAIEAIKDAVGAYLKALEDLFTEAGSDWEDLYFTKDRQCNPETFPYLEENFNLSQLWDNDNKLLKRFMSLDGEWFFEDTLNAHTLGEYLGKNLTSKRVVLTKLSDARKQLVALTKIVKMKPSPYYTIIHMDGDNMGGLARKFDAWEEHNLHSKQLSDFAMGQVYTEVENNAPGRLIYSGGDDVLAFVPLGYGLAVASKIAEAFLDKTRQTMSAGIVVVHHTHNLQNALDEARRAEQKAKVVDGKGAFALHFLRRSGEKREAVMKWVEGDGRLSVSHLIKKLTDAMREKHISRQLVSEMPDFVYSLAPFTEVDARSGEPVVVVSIPKEARELEFKRLFNRHIPKREDHKEYQSLRKQLAAIAESKPDGQGWHDVATLMNLARLVSQTEEVS